MKAVAEAFLKFSPRVSFREPNLLFIDVATTAHLFRSLAAPGNPESGVMNGAVALAKELGFETKAAISDTAAGAHALAHSCSSNSPTTICHPGEERETLQPLSLPLLLHMEGLVPWKNARAVEQIVTFFYMLGFQTIGDLDRFSLTSLQDRWGETGALLWKRINGVEQQVISPLLPTEALKEYVYLEFPISLTSLLLHQVRRSMQFLFARLQGRALYASRLVLHMHCEYSNTGFKVEVEPNNPNRNIELFLTLLENKLANVDLDNPIREFEIEVIPVAERAQQFDFFEPRTSDSDKLDSLVSLLEQASVRTGRYRLQDAVMPENSWVMSSTDVCGNLALATRQMPITEGAYQYLPEYGTSVHTAPRPTRLLKAPRALTSFEMQKIQILTGHPIERLEDAWWEKGERRDYYFAISSEGQCLWIYQDPENKTYYLHGYFD